MEAKTEAFQKVDGNVHTMPLEKDHVESVDCWCEPELIGDYTSEGGVKHFLHRDTQ